MANTQFARRPVAGWYMVAAIASLLFMLIGCAAFVLDVTGDPQALPLDQRTLVAARPVWSLVGYGIAVWAGLAGTVMLIVKRRIAEHLLLVSLIGAALTFLPMLVVPAVRDNISTNDIAVAVMIVVITWTIFGFARHSAKRGWLT